MLQTERVFTNVSKGEFAKVSDLQKVFGTSDQDEIIQLILEKGDLQVSDKEREQHYESMQRDIATWISENCVHPVTQRPYTTPQIRQAMREAEYVVHPTRSLKKQYLDCFKRIQSKAVLKIARAKMQVKLSYAAANEGDVKKVLDQHNIVPTNRTDDGPSLISITLLVDPSLYRPLEDVSKSAEAGRLEILNQVVKRVGDTTIDEEIRENQHLQEQQEAEQQATAVSQTIEVDVAVELSTQTQQKLTVDDDEDDNSSSAQHNSLRKNQKKAQKKSKKAKRREKEEATERQVRLEAEQARQQARQEAGTGNNKVAVTTTETATPGNKSCNTCGGNFTMAEYRAHFKSDWHRYNQKLKLQGVAPVCEKEFRLCDSDAFF